MADHYIRSRDRSNEVGLCVAAASAPRSMQNGLMPRSTADQGIATGVTMSIAYLLAAIGQDVIDGATNTIVNDRVQRGVIDAKTAQKRQLQYSALASSIALFAGFAGQTILSQKSEEKAPRAIFRTLSYWTSVVGAAGLSVVSIEALTKTRDSNNTNKQLWPLIIPVGVLLALGIDRVKPASNFKTQIQSSNVKRTRAIGIGLGVSLMLAGFVFAEKTVAKQLNKLVNKYVPSMGSLHIPVGHIVALWGIIFAGKEAVNFAMKKAEHGGDVVEYAFADYPKSNLVSGSRKSYVPWGTLSKEGRRFVSTVRSARDIENVMKITKAKEPIRIFVGLDSEKTEENRVNLALAELERTKAYERELIVVTSPTGTGYINYVMAESVEYCSKGNDAIVALQYSKRPSPLSLDRVNYGHIQFRMLLNGIKKYLKEHPECHPRIVLFGESLGAWTSQDAFMYQGTDGFNFLGVDAALWIGTPAQSSWKNQVLDGQKRLDTDYESIGTFHSTEQLMALPKKQRDKLKYVMLTNANDPIAKFDIKLLFQSPYWLQNDNPNKMLTGVPRWRAPGTFIQTLIDMKNALKPKPGQFVSDGHDYRATLLPFVNEIYRLNVPAIQLASINKAMIRNEIERAKKISLKA